MNVRVTRQRRRRAKVWVVDWTDREGKRHQPQFETKEAAEAEEERIRQTLRAMAGRTPELPADTTWAGLFERVMGGQRGDLKPRTLETYRQRLRRAGIDPDNMPAVTPLAPLTGPPVSAPRATAGEDPLENPAHFLGLLDELHDGGVLTDDEYGAARLRLLERLRS